MNILSLLLAAAVFHWSPVAVANSPDTNVSIMDGRIVANPTLAPLAGAKVHLVSKENNLWATADAQGHYQFMRLLPGTYAVEVKAPNGTVMVHKDAYISAGNHYTWDFALARH